MRKLFVSLIAITLMFFLYSCENDGYQFAINGKTYSASKSFEGALSSALSPEESWNGDNEAKTSLFNVASASVVRFSANNVDGFPHNSPWSVEIRNDADGSVFKMSYDRTHNLTYEVYLESGDYYIIAKYDSTPPVLGIHISNIEIWEDRYEVVSKYIFYPNKVMHEYTNKVKNNIINTNNIEYTYALAYPELKASNKDGSIDMIFNSENSFYIKDNDEFEEYVLEVR